MARYHGAVGYGETVESPSGSGVWVDEITERSYFGDVVRNSRQLRENGDRLNDDLTVGNTISIVADAYAFEHFFNIRYVAWSGALWKVSNVEVEAPRLQLRLGEIYNGPIPSGGPQ